MQFNISNSQAAGLESDVTDLSPLAWILEELRKSLGGAVKVLRRFVRDAEQAGGSDLVALDASQLRIARQQLHQSMGALEIIGLSVPALFLRAMENSVQSFVLQPQNCTADSAAKLERASFALTEYLQSVLSDRPVSSISLFPQYREILEIVRADRIHPADLWLHTWSWIDTEFAQKDVVVKEYGPEARALLDYAMLRLMKGKASTSAENLRDLCLGFSAAPLPQQSKIFWRIAAAYFEALAHDLLESDIYVKRATSRILLQYTLLAKGDEIVSERLAHDLIFFCAQARFSSATSTPLLAAIRSAYGLNEHNFVNYQLIQFGRFDPALLVQARKRINSAKESWSALAAGDLNKLKNVADQFSLVADSLVKLHPSSAPLAKELCQAVESTVLLAQAPRIELAMEVATSIMYLEAAFEDLDPNDSKLTARTLSLAKRLEGVRVGGDPKPLEIWMEELYGRVSDKQTMGSVVGELRISLAEIEKELNAFFCNPADKAPLQDVPGKLSQMRGVLSVLGLDQAAHTALKMRSSVKQILEADSDAAQVRIAGTFDQLGNNVGALSFLIDMLNYQPVLAKKLFIFDEEKGELTPLMGRTNKHPRSRFDEINVAALAVKKLPVALAPAILTSISDLGELFDIPHSAAPADHSLEIFHKFNNAVELEIPFNGMAGQISAIVAQEPLASPELSTQTMPRNFEEDDLQEIFLDEAREVTASARDALAKLVDNPSDVGELTVLRRAFHTLKGSSRMVGLKEFGDAAWSFEQLNNSWLADQTPAGNEFRILMLQALAGFEGWITAIASKRDAGWTAYAFITSADAMRTTGSYVALILDKRSIKSQEGVNEDLVFAEDVSEVGLEPSAVQNVDMDEAFDAIDLGNLPLGDSSGEIVVIVETFPAIQADPYDLPTFQLTGLPDNGLLQDIPVISDLPQDIAFFVDAQEMTDIDFNALFDVFEASKIVNSSVVVASISTTLNESLLQVIDIPAFFDVDGVELELPLVDLQEASADSMLSMVSTRFGPEPSVAEELLTSVLVNGLVASRGGPVDGEVQDAEEDEQVRLIGSLRIGIPLYNVYLNEADEWSRRLVTEIGEWALEDNCAVSDSTVALAHSLSGSSATVGFQTLSEIAKALEDALQKSQLHYSVGNLNYSALFVDAVEDIRRLLHHFAAGFLKEANADILAQLKGLDFTDSLVNSLGESTDPRPIEAGQPVLPASVDSGELRDGLAAFDTESQEVVNVTDAAQLHTAFVTADTAEFPEKNDETGETAMLEPSVFTATEKLFSTSSTSQVGAELSSGHVAAEVLPQLPQSTENLIELGYGLDSDEQDIDATDSIDLELFPIFEEEAVELLPQLGATLRQWSLRPENQSARMEVLRVLHTLKGSARLAGAMRLGEMSHRVESQVESLGSGPPPANEFDELLTRFDAMQGCFDVLRAAALMQPVVSLSMQKPDFVSGIGMLDLGEEFDAALANVSAKTVSPQSLSAEVLTSSLPQTQLAQFESKALDVKDHESKELQAPLTDDRKIVIPPPQAMIMTTVRQAAGVSVRVRSQLLDRMVNQIGEVMISRSRLEAELSQLRGSLGDMNANLTRLRQHLRDIELQAETQMQSRLAQAKEAQAGFDPLEIDRFTRVQELTRMMAESVNDVATVQRTLQRTVEVAEDDLVAQARQTRELQRDLLRTRMVEFESISDRLYRVVRQASKDTGKQVKLDLVGGSIEMDRGMLDRMTPAFEHLLRNCVAHGIEDQTARIAAGKVAVGLITVQIRHEGNDVSVDFSDDGNGLNFQLIHERAVSQGLVVPDTVLTEQETADLIFLPGFTTALQVTELAGRGIGMDVVRSEVTALGGRIETSTVVGQGTHFKLILPLTTAVTQVVMIRSGQLSIGVPATLIETVRRVSPHDLQVAYATGSFDVSGTGLPFLWAGTLLQSSRQSAEMAGRTLPVVIFRSADQRLALHVDEVLGNQEVVVKNLGLQMSRLPGLSGMSVLASGAVVLIYNPVALASIYSVQAKAWAALDTTARSAITTRGSSGNTVDMVTQKSPLILVVDDSITVRRVTQRLLQREGFRVAMAADGLQALERLRDEVPSVVLSDIEMPRMDGFDLARNIRGNAQLKHLPIIMITSRIAEKHREHAMELGVDQYLGKPYSEDELMALVRHYCAAEVALAA